MQHSCLTLLIALSLSCFFIQVSEAQQATIDTITASKYYKKADSLLTDKKYKESIALFKKALPVYKKAKAWEKVASCYNKISENQQKSYKPEQVLQNVEKALSICKKYLTKDHRELATSYFNKGVYYQMIDDYDLSVALLKNALSLYEKKMDWKKVAVCHNDIGIAYYHSSKYDEALASCYQALEINLKTLGPKHGELGQQYSNIGVIYHTIGKHHIALAYYKKALKISIDHFGENHRMVGKAYINLGVTYNLLGQDDNVLTYYQKATAIFLNLEDLYPLSLSYLNIGTYFLKNLQYNRALEYMKKSLAVTKRIPNSNRVPVANCYRMMGDVSREKGDFEKALEFYKKSLKIFSAIDKDGLSVSTTYRNIGQNYEAMKKYNIAHDYYKKSIAIYRVLFGEDEANVAQSINLIGNLHLKKKEYNDALINYKKGKQIIEKVYGKRSPRNSSYFGNIANVYNELGNHEKALFYFNRALALNINGNKSNKNYYDSNLQLDLWQKKIKALNSQYHKTNNIDFLQKSIVGYREMDFIIKQARLSYRNQKDKIEHSKRVNDTYAITIKGYLSMYRINMDSKFLKDAIYYSERSRSNTLKELLTDANAKDFGGLSQEILKTEKLLKTNRAYFQSQINNELYNITVDTAKVIYYENELFKINRKQDSLAIVFEKDYPNYYQLKHQNRVIGVTDIQEKIDEYTTLLEYFTTDSLTYIFSISKKNFRVKELSTPRLSEKIAKFKKAMQSKDMIEYKKLAHELYNILVAPIHQEITGNEIIIIPDGSLWQLNFDLLLTNKSPSQNSEDLPYLLKDYAITYANSANLLFNSFKQEKSKLAKANCLAFSFTNSEVISDDASQNLSLATSRSNTSDDLPGTRKEIKAISDIIDGQYYFGKAANEANFKKNASRYSILHLALHGEVDNERPENSKLFFTKSKDSIEDNILYAHELFALNIPAELTVLSACNTGTGKIAKGEGIMSLGNAFQYAGTKSLLLSRWEVPDETAPELMQHFYSNLKNGMSKGKALQHAKLSYLKSADIYHKSPFYWGGFYLVGDNSPIEFGNTSYWYWILGLGILISLSIGTVLYRMR